VHNTPSIPGRTLKSLVALWSSIGWPYFKDVKIGQTREIDERYDVTKSEIIEFAERYEPWVQHVDAEAAHESEYVERLTAGTLHLCVVGLRLLYDTVLADSHAPTSYHW
jgi:acyl dehydratase